MSPTQARSPSNEWRTASLHTHSLCQSVGLYMLDSPVERADLQSGKVWSWIQIMVNCSGTLSRPGPDSKGLRPFYCLSYVPKDLLGHSSIPPYPTVPTILG
eukprot:2270536-Rhodomonas_salina.2